jgi:low temperature requirement protein LtrA
VSERDLSTLVDEATPEEEERKTSFLELFFDLVFVFAFTQVTALILEDTSAAGFARATLVLGLVWWAWSAYAWMTNAIDVESLVTKLIVFAAMGGAFFMALAVPDAYQDEGSWFAVAYFAVRVANSALYAWGVRRDRVQLRATLSLAPWFFTAALVALAGGFVSSDVRPYVWLASLAIDVAGALAVARAGFRVSPAHFAERYGLIVIIALGESVVAVGLGASALERDAVFAASVGVALAGVVTLWWAYFDFTATAAQRSLTRTSPERRGPVARDVFTFFHFPIVLGIVFYAVAAEKMVAHPTDPLSPAGRWALGLGLALFLSGFALARFRVVRRIAWERVAGGIGALAVAGLLDSADAIVTLAVAVGVVLAAVALEGVRLREIRTSLRTG